MDDNTKDLVSVLDPLLCTLARIFAAEGKAREVAVLANAKASIQQSGYDSWDGGTYLYTVSLEIPTQLDAQIAAHRDEIQQTILLRAQGQVRSYLNEGIEAVVIIAKLEGTPDWQNQAKAWLTGKNVTNQGRVRSDNVASRECDGLLFRSEPEILLYRALKAAGITFAPLPVFLRGGNQYRRLEPDFVIIKDGVVMQVEIDGDTVHTETPVEAHNRVTLMTHEGVHVERVRAEECNSLEAAEFVAQKLLQILAKVKAAR
jgi:hypothetical protein